MKNLLRNLLVVCIVIGLGFASGCSCEVIASCSQCGGDNKCTACDGSGEVMTGKQKCSYCQGNSEFVLGWGKVPCPDCDGLDYDCGTCNGNGSVDCGTCGGSGFGADYVYNACNECGGSGICDACNE